MKLIPFLNILLILGTLACSSNVTPLEFTKAKLVNNLAVDGCDWHFTVESKDEIASYLPNDTSKEKVNTLIKTATAQYGMYSVEVEMKYTLTGKKQTVQCGWGKTNEMDEIEILEIRTTR